MLFNILTIDPPYNFNDKIDMNHIKRGAESQYKSVMSNLDIVNLPIIDIAADDAVLALWVPSSLLDIGLLAMKNYGFKQTQTHVWNKIKKNPFKDLIKQINKSSKEEIIELLNNFDFNSILAFGMGRLFRGVHEICLLGVRGKVYQHLENKSQRSVHFDLDDFDLNVDTNEMHSSVSLDINTKHSKKPETLQNRLELMFPQFQNKIEIFGRRQRNNWFVLGNEAPMTYNEDIKISLSKIKNLSEPNIFQTNNCLISENIYLDDWWKNLPLK